MGRWHHGLAIAGLILVGGCSRPERLVVYTAAEADQIPAYTASFKKAHPEIELVWVRDSTGVVTAKLLAEKKAPQADAVFALAATSMMQLDSQGLLGPYTPKGAERLDPRFRDTQQPAHWTGEALWSALICANTHELSQRGLPVPTSWEDLTKPIYKGMIAMPNPASSGTGLLAVGAWLQMFGEDRGWAYMDRLNSNIVSYDHSGSKPCKDAARGEVPIGISIDYRAAQEKGAGLPLAVVVPTEGVGWDVEASGVIAHAKHEQAARTFVDWAMSDDAMRLYARNFSLVGAPGVAQPVPNLPADLSTHLAKVDLRWTGQNRDRIITEWTRRYDSKSAPKQ
ncbi:MAG: putative 2-aminoethylphosphonate ABC transporter substrate-binding protein [Caulobacteraceae bacterium]|nr:putative 2-aminoethylphosphonate ABC transporter substrate-binding protein [Caulobacteraceae bacterium]